MSADADAAPPAAAPPAAATRPSPSPSKAEDGAVADVIADLEELRLLPAGPDEDSWSQRLDLCRRLLRLKVAYEARRQRLAPEAPILAVVTGGTNVGKSAVVNALLGQAVSKSSPLARGTKWPAILVHEADRAALQAARPIEGYAIEALTDPELPTRAVDRAVAFRHVHADDRLRGIALIDSPDVDSDYEANHRVADDLLLAADLVVFVTTPEKYNDDACMEKLRAAALLRKDIVVVLNKTSPAEAETLRADLRTVVDEAIDAGSGRGPEAGALVVVEVPAVPGASDPARLAGSVASLADIVCDRDAHADTRRRAVAGASENFAAGLDAIVTRVEEEARQIELFGEALRQARALSVAHYRRALDEIPMNEVDEIWRRVLEELRIPILDDAYDAVGALGRGLFRGFQKLTGSGAELDDAEGPGGRRVRKVREQEREEIRKAFAATERAIADAPGRVTEDYRVVADAWRARPPEATAQAAAADAALRRVEQLADDWINEETQRQVSKLADHPERREVLRAVRGALRLGPAVLTAWATGGFGPWDALTGPAVDLVMKNLFDKLGDRVYFQRRRGEHFRDRAALIGEESERLLIEPVRSRLPGAVAADVVDRLRAVAKRLETGGELAGAGS